MRYSVTPYARERIKSPFKRVENRQVDWTESSVLISLKLFFVNQTCDYTEYDPAYQYNPSPAPA
jgi:hypothetical protein